MTDNCGDLNGSRGIGVTEGNDGGKYGEKDGLEEPHDKPTILFGKKLIWLGSVHRLMTDDDE